MSRKKCFFGLLFLSFVSISAWGQHLNVKTNLLYDATTTINLGLEMGLGKKTSLDISGNFNGWTLSNDKQLKHWLVQPEFRLWLCEKFNGHFFGIHALGGQFDLYRIELPFDIYPGMDKNNNRGNFYGGGLSYGYQWILGNRWGIEATLGVGYIYTKYDIYSSPDAETKKGDNTKNYFGPTKAGITLIYFIY